MPAKRQGRPRQRAQLSCDTCRRYKRKCDRVCPCAECRFRGKACSFEQATADAHAAGQTHQISPVSIEITPSASVLYDDSNPDAGTNLSAVPSLSTNTSYSPPDELLPRSTSTESPHLKQSDHGLVEQLEALVCSSNVLHHIIAVWRHEDDWYHEVVLGSPFWTAITQQQTITPSLVRQYVGVIYSILALVAQLHPSELEAILIRLSTAASVDTRFTSAVDLGNTAEQAAKHWVAQATLPDSDPLTWRAIVFQTSFLLMKLNKFCGRWVEYRQCLGLDLGRLQRANYHRLSGLLRDKDNTYEEISTRHRIFWHYFTLERLSSTFDGIPYTMQARNADMWLIEGASAVHIHLLCGDECEQINGSLPCYVPSALNLALSRRGQQMVRLAAQAGRFQYQIATLSAASTLSPQQRFERGNEIAASIDRDLVALQERFKLEALGPQHGILVAIGLARVRRDVSILLCDSLQLDSEDALLWRSSAQNLHRRRLDLDRQLIRCAVDYAGRVMLSLLGEPFFTHFICDSVMVLASSVQKDWPQSHSANGDTIFDDIKSALIGRNLLVVISKQSELAQNQELAAKTCQLLASVINQIFPVYETAMSLSKNILNTTRIVSIDDYLSLVRSFSGQSDSYAQVMDAESLLEWIASYPALQHIFDLPVSDFESTQTMKGVASIQS